MTASLDIVMDQKSQVADRWKAAVRDLFPHRNAEELKRAEEVLERYFRLVIRVWEGIEHDPEKRARYLVLTGRKPLGEPPQDLK